MDTRIDTTHNYDGKKATLEDLQQITRDLGESQKETDRSLKESNLLTDRRLKKLDDLFTGQWGKLIETLVEGDLIKLLKEKNIRGYSSFWNSIIS